MVFQNTLLPAKCGKLKEKFSLSLTEHGTSRINVEDHWNEQINEEVGCWLQLITFGQHKKSILSVQAECSDQVCLTSSVILHVALCLVHCAHGDWRLGGPQNRSGHGGKEEKLYAFQKCSPYSPVAYPVTVLTQL